MNTKISIIGLEDQIYENETNFVVYKIINKNLKKFIKDYPIGNNILSVYSIHLLKFITAMLLKKNELKKNNVIQDFSDTYLDTFPYISYQEVYKNEINNKKKFGIHSNNKNRQFLKGLIYYFDNLKNNKLSSSLNALSIIDYKYLKKYIDVNYLFYNKRFAFIDLENQIKIIETIINEIFENIPLPFSPKLLFSIFKKHILANSFEGRKINNIAGDFLLLTSGNDTLNRHLASIAKQFDKKVIILDHAYYTGYTDDINLGMGEQYFSDYFITFGNFYKKKKLEYNLSHEYKNTLITSSSKKILNIKSIKSIQFKYNLKTKFYYIPTSLRGPNYRFGPFMDIADKTYLNWQRNLVSLFKEKLLFKHHPKDKYKKIYSKYHKNINFSYESIYNILNTDNNTCYIFDTIGTAFAEIAASKFPIIFFDLHQRKIPNFVLDKIKQRCVYIDILNIKKLDFSYIEDLLINKNFNYNALDNFSIDDSITKRDQIEVLNDFLLNKL